MGFALPAAVGVQLAKPETCVLCVSGDGGFQMNIQELATVHRLGLPVKMVIIDNKYLGMVRQWQQLFYQRNYAETDLSDNPDFVEIAKAYKIHSLRLNEDAMREFPVSSETGDQIDRFLRSPRAGVAGVRLRAGGQCFSDGAGGRGAFGDVAGRGTGAITQGSGAVRRFGVWGNTGSIGNGFSHSLSQYARDVDAHPERGFAARAGYAFRAGRTGRAGSPGYAACSR